jgi:hypothetical protein
MEYSESIKELAAALCKFHAQVGKVKKGNENPFFKSKYADLSSILDAIEEPLHQNELTFVQFPVGEHEMTTMLMHTSGEWIKGTYTMTPTKKDPQGLGSVITYQRRYALGAILGLNIDEDDDGNDASKTPSPEGPKSTPKTTIEQAVGEMHLSKNLDDLKRIWTKHQKFQTDDKFVNAKDQMKNILTK